LDVLQDDWGDDEDAISILICFYADRISTALWGLISILLFSVVWLKPGKEHDHDAAELPFIGTLAKLIIAADGKHTTKKVIYNSLF